MFTYCFVAAAETPLPRLRSKAAALYDFETGALLFSKDADTPVPPASMTKLMTLHLTYRAIKDGRITLDTRVRINNTEDFRNLPPRSALMFLEAGQEVTVYELMQGLAVPSGNDAALVLARVVAGSVDGFVAEMNREASRLGFDSMYFEDPAGLSEKNRVTARQFGEFCIHYIRSHPESLNGLHDLPSFTYPTELHVRNGEPAEFGPITQNNYNVLIGRHPWVDGLKTGYIDESGYNIALTATAGGRRVVAVLLGGPGNTPREGAFTRAIDGTNIISYGLYAFQRVVPSPPEPKAIRVWFGAAREAELELPEMQPLVLSAEKYAGLRYEYVYEEQLRAPVSVGKRAGFLKVLSGDELLAEYPLYPKREIASGSWFRHLIDAILLFFQ